ncbi:hypothetical protein F5B19DRAFT_492810 [Rostrohypoxylon terebratum]|nr:hypothetical protein F5B19DRAFT_492810 [Rostrohypoxylon terebratum]
MANKKTPKEVGKATKKRVTNTAVPAVAGACGKVTDDGSFECRLSIQGRSLCGARMKNEAHNIRSHISKKHRDGSSYKNNQKRGSWLCTWSECEKQGRTYPNFNSLLAHARRAHHMRGPSKELKDKAAKYRQKMLKLQKQKKRSAKEEEGSGTDDEEQAEGDSLSVDDMSDISSQQGDEEDDDPPAMGGSSSRPISV